MGTNILDPIILPGAYKNFLAENIPDFLEEIPLAERNKIIFQQDSAEPHNARVVTELTV